MKPGLSTECGQKVPSFPPSKPAPYYGTNFTVHAHCTARDMGGGRGSLQILPCPSFHSVSIHLDRLTDKIRDHSNLSEEDLLGRRSDLAMERRKRERLPLSAFSPSLEGLPSPLTSWPTVTLSTHVQCHSDHEKRSLTAFFSSSCNRRAQCTLGGGFSLHNPACPLHHSRPSPRRTLSFFVHSERDIEGGEE